MNSTFYKSFRYSAAALLCSFVLLFTSCSREEPEEPTIEQQPTTAQLTSTVHYAADKMTAYNFTYTSTDPYGEPVTLSATITMSDKLTTDDIAEGIMLYNHFTVYRDDQCPSLGYLGEQAMIVGSGLITISPDYYGFGVTEDKPQAHCISRDNAQAAVDALIEGRKLLAQMGFRWKDNLFNVGYSQGGQTSLAVVRLITEKYPNIHITKTFAGGGSYDLPATYRRFVVIDRSAMPSTVISVMLAYNHFKELGIARDSMFLEPVLSHIDDWVLNKRYTREEIDALVGTNDLSVFISPAMMDTNSSVSHRMMAALDGDNLCKGWTPRSDESLMLVHHTLDGAVPVENTLNLIAFLQQQGVTDVDVVVGDFGNAMGMPAHETGALMLINAAKEWLCQYLGIAAW